MKIQFEYHSAEVLAVLDAAAGRAVERWDLWRIVCYFGTSFFMCVQKRVHKKQKSVRTNVPTLFLLVRKMGLEPKLLRFTVEISCTKAITAVFSLY